MIDTLFRVLRSAQRGSLLLVAIVTVALGIGTVTRAGDWPHPLGPTRNGIADPDESIIESWRGPKPKVLWERPVGNGYAGLVVAQGRLILFHRENDQEVVECLRATDGGKLWKKSYETTFQPQVGSGTGPLCTPTIIDDRVITYGAQGVLTCWDLQNGETVWTRPTHADFGASEGYFGAGSSPLVEGNVVVVNVGAGRKKAGIVGFNLQSGETLWQQTAEDAGYSAPTVATIDEQRFVIAITRLKCVGLNPTDGSIWFEFPFGSRGPTVNGATPLVFQGNHLFVSSSYGVGATVGRISILGFEQLWNSDNMVSSQYATCIEHEDNFYGIHGRDDIPPTDLKCFDPIRKKVHWVQQNFGYGNMLKADGKLLILKTDGELVIIRPTVESCQELARGSAFSTTTRALPALSNGLLYARDEETLKCIDLRSQ